MAHKKAGGSSAMVAIRTAGALASRSSAARKSSAATSSYASAARSGTPARNVGMGKDHTLFALPTAPSLSKKGDGRSYISVVRFKRQQNNGDRPKQDLRRSQTPVEGSKRESGAARKTNATIRQAAGREKGETGAISPFSFRAEWGPKEAVMFPELTRDDVFRLETKRLWLRWPRARRRAGARRPAGDWEVARMTAPIPHPYLAVGRRAFIVGARRAMRPGRALTLAMKQQKATARRAIGVISVEADARERQARLLARQALVGRGLGDGGGRGDRRRILLADEQRWNDLGRARGSRTTPPARYWRGPALSSGRADPQARRRAAAAWTRRQLGRPAALRLARRLSPSARALPLFRSLPVVARRDWRYIRI